MAVIQLIIIATSRIGQLALIIFTLMSEVMIVDLFVSQYKKYLNIIINFKFRKINHLQTRVNLSGDVQWHVK